MTNEIQVLDKKFFLKVPGAINIQEKEIKNAFLPFIFIDNNDDYTMKIKITGKEEVLKSPWIFKHLFARECLRKLEGKEYKIRLYPPKPDQKEALKIYEEAKKKAEEKEDGWQKGVSNLLLLIKNDGAVTFVTFETFGANESYWLEAFKVANSLEGWVMVTIESHSKNTTTSKKGNEYLSCWKFSDWEELAYEEIPEMIEALDEAPLKELIDTAFLEQKEAIQKFINS